MFEMFADNVREVFRDRTGVSLNAITPPGQSSAIQQRIRYLFECGYDENEVADQIAYELEQRQMSI